jgi:hypothetical protein
MRCGKHLGVAQSFKWYPKMMNDGQLPAPALGLRNGAFVGACRQAYSISRLPLPLDQLRPLRL